MHGYPDWFMWAVVGTYWLIVVGIPAALAGAVWWLVRRRRK